MDGLVPGDEEGWFRGRGLDRVVPRLGLSTFLTRRSGGLRSFGTWPARRRQMQKSRGGSYLRYLCVEGELEARVRVRVKSEVKSEVRLKGELLV